jgi:membrane-associated phospholipid phosphatase
MIFASLISRIFDPLVGFTFLFFLTAFRSGVAGWDLVLKMIILSSTMILPPALLLFWAVQTKRVSNWDLSNRKQRVRALLVFVCFLGLDYFVLQSIGTPLMNQVFVVIMLLFSGFFLITLRWKISGHMTTATLIILLLISWYEWRLWPLLFIIPFLGWSRLVLKRHTIGEVVGGVVYSLAIFFLARELHLI